MEAFLQARSRDAGAARAVGLPAGIDRLVADPTTRIFGERLRRSRENGGLAIMTGLANGAEAYFRYAYKASLIGAAHQFELTDEGLSWQIGGKAGVWPYGDIAAIRLSYRPVSMQSRRFRADIEHANRQRIAILSTSWQTVALVAPH